MRLRFTIRRLMMVVAVLGCLLSLLVGMRRRGEHFRRLSAYHMQAAGVLIDRAGGPLDCGTGLTDRDIEEIFARRGRAERLAYKAALFHVTLAEKYERAADRPWLPVEADPPAPPSAYPEFDSDAPSSLADDGAGFR